MRNCFLLSPNFLHWVCKSSGLCAKGLLRLRVARYYEKRKAAFAWMTSWTWSQAKDIVDNQASLKAFFLFAVPQYRFWNTWVVHFLAKNIVTCLTACARHYGYSKQMNVAFTFAYLATHIEIQHKLCTGRRWLSYEILRILKKVFDLSKKSRFADYAKF